MAYRSSRSDETGPLHLDASGTRSVVYCHQCQQEWWEDEYGLECPHCEGNVTEIVTPGADDPRHMSGNSSPTLLSRPIEPQNGNSTDSNQQNIEAFISNGPNSSIIFRTLRSSSPRSTHGDVDTRDEASSTENRHVLTDFRNMISNFLGPQFRHSAPGRSGPDTLFREPSLHTSTFRFGSNGAGPSIVGGRIILTNSFTHDGALRPRNANEPQQEGAPQVDEIATIISSILAPAMGSEGTFFGSSDDSSHQTGPIGIQSLFSAFINPRNARFGDAVYSQEALDQILTTLMEQTTTSNAPGPAPTEAIAALPRKKLDSKLLDNGRKGECSICMDELKIGDEVMVLPCKHWFDETCATAWLKEHNTCPICRKGITEDSSSSNSPNSQQDQQSDPAPQSSNRQQRQSHSRSIFSRESRSRNEDRLNRLRDAAGLNMTDESSQQSGSPRPQGRDEIATSMPGSFPTEATDRSDNRSSGRPTSSRRSSNTRSNGNVSRSSTLNRIRGLHDRLNNNCRNN